MDKLIVWKDRANPVYIQLSKLGTVLTAEEMAAITKAELKYVGVYYNSTDHPTVFDLTTLAADGKIVIKPGLLQWEAGADIVELIIYDALNVDGIMWKQIRVTVKDDAIK